MEYQYTVENFHLFGKEKPIAFFQITSEGKCYKASLVTLEKFSLETFDEALNQLIFTLNNSHSIDACLLADLYPSVYFFFLNILKEEADFSKIATAALIMQPSKEKITEAIHLGFKTIKVKFPLWDNYASNLINYFITAYPQILFRIDFNQKLNGKSCLNLIKTLPFDGIDYIEEPCVDCASLSLDFPYKVAIDESLRNNFYFPLDYPLVFIIKPLLQQKLQTILNLLLEQKKRIIISSGFEPPCGIQTLKWIIKKNNLEKETHGFDTLKYYENLPHF